MLWSGLQESDAKVYTEGMDVHHMGHFTVLVNNNYAA